MLVDLARVSLDVPCLRRALGDLELVARDDGVGGVWASSPFLAVGAVAECYRSGKTQTLHVLGETKK